MKRMAYFTPNQEKSKIPVPGFRKFPSIFDLLQYFGEDKTHLILKTLSRGLFRGYRPQNEAEIGLLNIYTEKESIKNGRKKLQ